MVQRSQQALQFEAPFDGPLQAEIPFRSSRGNHPIQDEVTACENRCLVAIPNANRKAPYRILPLARVCRLALPKNSRRHSPLPENVAALLRSACVELSRTSPHHRPNSGLHLDKVLTSDPTTVTGHWDELRGGMSGAVGIRFANGKGHETIARHHGTCKRSPNRIGGDFWPQRAAAWAEWVGEWMQFAERSESGPGDP